MQPGVNVSTDSSVVGPVSVPEAGIAAKASYPGNFSELSDQKIASIFATLLSQADDYRKKFVAEWLKSYNQYNGVLDDANKAEWQSRLHVPKPRQAVDVSTARVMDALLQNEDFFDIVPYTREDDWKTYFAKRGIKWQLWKSEFREPLRTAIKNCFISGFGPMLVGYDERKVKVTKVMGQTPQAGETPGMDGGMLPVRLPQPGSVMETEVLRRQIKFEALVPTDVWLDPTGRGRYVIRRVKRTISDLLKMSEDQLDEQGQLAIPAVYNKDAIARLGPGSKDPEREVQSALIDRGTPHLVNDPAVDVYEFWGDLIEPATGNVLFRNIVMTVANKTALIRAPQSNPYRHGKLPFIIFTPRLSPFQVYPQGLLIQAAGISDEIDRMLNVVIDKARLQVPTIQMFPGSLKNQDDMGGDRPKFFPGKVWYGRDPEKPIFAPVEGFQPPSQQDFSLLQLLMSLYDQDVGVNEFATGNRQSQYRQTQDEVQAKAAATQQVFNDSAVHIEESALSPLLKMVYMLMIQYETEYDDPNLIRAFGDDPQALSFLMAIKEMAPEERWQLLYLDAEFRANALSLNATRQDKLMRMGSFLKFISQDPVLGMLVNRRDILRNSRLLFDQAPTIVLDQADAIIQAQEIAMLQQIMGPPQGQNAHNSAEQGAADASEAADNMSAEEPQPPQGPPAE